MPEREDAITMLKADHRRVEQLFAKFAHAGGSARKAAIAREICTELLVHAQIEEEIFYPTFRGKVEDELLDESYVEHDGARVLIAEILAAAPTEAFYDAKVTVLGEEIQHHVDEEERRAEGLFAQARITGVDMAGLGDRLRVRKRQLLGDIAMNGLPVPETRTMRGVHVYAGQPAE